MEAVNAHFECVKPRFREGSLSIVDPTAYSYSSEGSPIAELINKKLSIQEIVFLCETMEKHSRRISAMMTKRCDIENKCCLGVYCSRHPRSLAVTRDSSLIDSDSRRRRRSQK